VNKLCETEVYKNGFRDGETDAEPLDDFEMFSKKDEYKNSYVDGQVSRASPYAHSLSCLAMTDGGINEKVWP